jgi:hypothetical protein
MHENSILGNKQPQDDHAISVALRKILACLGMPIRAPPIAPALIEIWGDSAEDTPVYSDAYA